MSRPVPRPDEIAVGDALRELVGWDDASLVIFRRGAIVEFKTALLRDHITLEETEGHRSWQIGAFEGHHCHLDLAAVMRLHFDAESVPCQGGRVNYTAWFLVSGDCGNPYRPDALFSITLDRPYEPDGSPRLRNIAQVFRSYDRLSSHGWVDASAAFLALRTATAPARP